VKRKTKRAASRRPRRQWGSDRRTEPLPVLARPVSDRRITIGRMAIVGPCGMARLHDRHGDRAVRRGPGIERTPGRRGDRLPVRGDGTDGVGHGLPDHPDRVLLPQPRPSARAAGSDRPVLRSRGADGDGARAVVSGGRACHPHHAALGGAPGASLPEGRAAHRRSGAAEDPVGEATTARGGPSAARPRSRPN
jgi:hypothetical protein